MKNTLFSSLLLLLLFAYSVSRAQLKYADSMQYKISIEKNDSVKALSALKLAFHYVFNDSAQARKYLDMAMKLSVEKHIPYGEVNAYNVSGIFYDVQGMSDSALIYFKKGLEVNKKYGYADMDARLLNNLGMYSWNKGQLTEAQSYFFKALEKNALVTDSIKRQDNSAMLSNIGLIYQEQDLYEKALEYHYKALTFRREHKLNRYIPLSLNNIGICYTHLDSVDKAIEIFNEGIVSARKTEDYRALGDLLSNLASSYTEKGLYNKSVDLYLEILGAQNKFKLHDKIILNVEANTAGNYMLLRNYGAAWIHMKKAMSILEAQPDLKFYASSLYTFASALHYHDGNPEKGFEYQMLSQELHEEKVKEDNVKKTSELEVQYETKKKEATIAAQQLRIAQDQRAIAQRNFWLIFVSAAALLVLGAFYVIQSKRKLKAEKEEERKINSAIFESEQKERIRIARDLHDSIGQKLSVIKMLLTHDEQNENTMKAAKYLDETVAEVRTISHNLIPDILNFGLFNAVESLADTINSTENIHVEFRTNDSIQHLHLSKQTELSVYRIIQEILANIIKHAKTDRIAIDMNAQSNQLQIDIHDNGIGFNTDAIEQSEGLGWKNVFARIKLINGSLKVASDKNKGSRFYIAIPVA